MKILMNNPIIVFWVITCVVTFAWLVAEFLFVHDAVRVWRTFSHSRKYKMLTVVVPIVESTLGIFLIFGWVRLLNSVYPPLYPPKKPGLPRIAMDASGRNNGASH